MPSTLALVRSNAPSLFHTLNGRPDDDATLVPDLPSQRPWVERELTPGRCPMSLKITASCLDRLSSIPFLSMTDCSDPDGVTRASGLEPRRDRLR